MRLAWLLLALPALAEVPRYEKDVLPIFTRYCFTCHGQSSPKQGLDLRTAATALRGSHNGPVVSPGKLDESLLWKKVSSRQMPPAIYGQTVPDADIETVKRWIEGGAPSDAPPPTAEPPQVLAQRCGGCHGGAKPAAGLNVASAAAILRGSANGPVVVEGFSERSLLIRRMTNGTMPPKGAGTPLTEPEIQTVREWIDRGGFNTNVSANSADRPFTPLEDPPIPAEKRQFWAFQPPRAPAVPRVKAAGRVRTPIDAFLLSALESKGLTFSTDAPKEKLLRRAYLDLTGLPPTPAERKEFLDDASPTAYEKLVDKLLASPRYGERWARQWLDAAGYVDTTGKDFDPRKAEYADGLWRYRDYVIASINRDKPWDRFLTEQIAGDELVDFRNAKAYSPELLELLAATGYLRTILDITEEDISNLPVERYEALFKLVEKVGASTLGLTVNCARCHSHKFDPISQRDYYRFLALFTTSYNPSDWIQPQNHHLYTVPKAEAEAIKASNQALELRLREAQLEKLPEAIRADTAAAYKAAAEKRTEVQRYLVGKFNPGLQAELSSHPEFRKLEKVQALWDHGSQPVIRLLQRGSADAPGPRVTPGFLSVLSPDGKTDAVRPPDTQGTSSGVRLAFARWLTAPNHPLTARVIVNRIWQGHFGTGIVATPDNFGTTGSAPSNAALLDYLATDFVANGWSAKRLHRQILLSTAYRQNALRDNAKAEAVDPENKLLWRRNLVRLDAESLRDSILAASGKLVHAGGGPPIPLEMRPDGLQVVSTKAPEADQWRRSIYLTHRRTYPMSFLGVFDYPIIDTACAARVPSATPLQSLTLMNDDFVWKAADALTAHAENSVEAAYLLTLSRPPTGEEKATATEFLRTQPFRALAQALLSTNEFLYID